MARPGKDRHHHGQPVGLADHEARRRRARRAGRRLRGQGGLGPPHAQAPLRLCRGRQGARPQGDHRRRRRGRAPARHDGGHDHAARARRADRQQGAVGPGQPAVDRADAGRRAGRHAGHRRGRRHQCRPARRADPGARGRGARQAARGPARQADGDRFPRRRRTMPDGSACAQPLPPGSTIGILGSGQLGRMLALAAARLGLKTHIYCEESGPAFDVATHTTKGALRRHRGARRVRRRGRCGHLRVRERAGRHGRSTWPRLVPVRPGAKALEVAQDRLVEKQFIAGLGIAVAPVPRRRRAVETSAPALAALGGPGHPEDAPPRLRRQGPGRAWRPATMRPRPGSGSARSRRCSRSASPSRSSFRRWWCAAPPASWPSTIARATRTRAASCAARWCRRACPQADLARARDIAGSDRRRARLRRRAGGRDVLSRRPTRRRPSG